MIEDNHLATVNLLTAVQDVGCRRMVVTGTLSEGSGEAASSPYAAAKSAATEYTRMFHSMYGTPVVCLRLSMVYGPGQPDASKLVPHVVESLLEGQPPCVSSGRFETDWIYIDDVVDALLRAAVAEGVEGQALDVGSGNEASVREVVELLAATIDRDKEPLRGRRGAPPGALGQPGPRPNTRAALVVARDLIGCRPQADGGVVPRTVAEHARDAGNGI